MSLEKAAYVIQTRAMRAYVLFLVCLGLVRTVHGDCDRPSGGANMILSGSNNFPVPDGTSVTFSCETGYKPKGTSGTIACSQGAWTNLRMICEIIQCGNAGEVEHGSVDYTEGTEFGAKIYTVCDLGYTKVGDGTLYCGVNGWQGRLAVCEAVICDQPDPVTNGQFIPSADVYQYLNAIIYSCDNNYVLNGSKTRTCTKEGVFSPSPPTCVLVKCTTPNVTNGVVASGSRPPFTHMTSVTIRCNTGYTLTGSDTLSCGINSQWEPALPTCKPSECKAPEIKNGQVEDGAQSSYKYLETVTLKCDTGYTLSGQSTLTCGANEQWSAAIPTCTQIQCQAPEVKDGELVGGSRPTYKYLDSVTFECKSGYTLNGQSTLKCELNSQWSSKLPECIPIECKTPEVEHGQLVSGSPTSYKYLDSVRFECKSGYTMNGPSSLTCHLNRQWSPELPKCIRSNGHVIKIVLGVLAGICAVGVGIFFVCRKKNKGAGKSYKEAAQEAETVALS